MTPTAADEATPAAAAAATAPVTAGEALRRARDARGLHIAALAATLKVPQSKLEALEADRYQDLPDATFARALARSVCRVLKIETDPVLAMLPRSGAEAALDRVTPGLNQPFRERALSQEPILSAGLLKSPVVLGVGALLLAALLVYVVPSTWIEQISQRLRPESASSTAAVETPPLNEAPTASPSADGLPADAASATTLPPQSSGAPSDPAVNPFPPAATPATTSTATSPAATASMAAVTPAAPGAASVPPPAGAVPLIVKATAESWVEVVDARGQVLLSRLLRAGDQADLNGVAPLKLRVGNVSGTSLTYRGQPVDLAARSRDNVARLEMN